MTPLLPTLYLASTLILLLPRTSCTSTFPCPPVAEEHAPSRRTVHQLRPQDIGLVASLGDSITAGTGALATNILEVLNENRGSTYLTGGDGDWTSCLSVHNLLRQFNPSVRGGSRGSTRVLDIPLKPAATGDPGLNLSMSGAVAADLPAMTHSLVNKIRVMEGWREEWKLVSILIGHNDICSKSCVSPLQQLGLSRRVSVEPWDYAAHLRASLDLLAALPRTMVVLMAPAQVTLALDLRSKGPLCALAHVYECPCLFGPGPGAAGRARADWLWTSYRAVLARLATSPTYSREDFTVELVTTVGERDIFPEVAVGGGRTAPDLALLAPDCYHFTKDLHARIARNLWNNLLQPVGRRTLDYRPTAPIVCPSRALPYLATKGNSPDPGVP